MLAKRIGQIAKAVLLNTKVARMTAESDGIRVTLEGADVKEPEQVFDSVLVAVGRRPNSDIPGLDRTAVQVDARGFIVVDEQRRTHEPSIFAIGDVVGEPMLAHKASHEGRIAVEVIVGENVAFEPLRDPGGRLHRSRDRLVRPDRDAGGQRAARRSRSRSSRGPRQAGPSRSIGRTG